ncbi:hypothetical protein M438DRAFT_345939 [Aureobasidium pullulans EXF-150]|uniref:Uncharacterized protein n=1 Tax=Aureobasidium pullulans EXF-150 TaxID=1043002 RepID=A0A074YAG2_AURPU|nr:uncharacterized protein M438DRAFT_345939 [Aureobasidium pullulans EXF-150]KEQ83851.1 hypothetical protein M438DRAFT_345939 [Aureobasidium pullulans EXF-150]
MGNPISEAYNLTAISFSWAYISQTILRNTKQYPRRLSWCSVAMYASPSQHDTKETVPFSVQQAPHKNLYLNLLFVSPSSTHPSSILFLPSTKQNDGQYGGRTRDLFTSRRFDMEERNQKDKP